MIHKVYYKKDFLKIHISILINEESKDLIYDKKIIDNVWINIEVQKGIILNDFRNVKDMIV